LALSVVAFALRTLFGWSHTLPLLLTLSPLLLPVGYVIGQVRVSRR